MEVDWRHLHASEPIRLVSELDDARCETRKIEYFRDGAIGYASIGRSVRSTQLGSVPVPELLQINSDTQFGARLISAEQFDVLWRALCDE